MSSFQNSRLPMNRDGHPARQLPPDAALDRSLDALREECARTLTLMRALRSSPLYAFASPDPRADAGR